MLSLGLWEAALLMERSIEFIIDFVFGIDEDEAVWVRGVVLPCTWIGGVVEGMITGEDVWVEVDAGVIVVGIVVDVGVVVGEVVGVVIVGEVVVLVGVVVGDDEMPSNASSEDRSISVKLD